MPIPDPLSDGDAAFLGVNMNVEPSQVPQGHVALANNIRFDKGRIRTRAGTKCLDWSKVEVYENKPYAAGEKVLFSGKKGGNIRGVTVINASGYAIANGITITVDAIGGAFGSGDFVTFINGGVFTLTSSANSGATSLVGNLTGAALVNNETGTNVGLNNVANSISESNFVSNTAFTDAAQSGQPWFKQHTPANTEGAWTLDTTNNVAKISEPSGSVINLNQEIGSTNLSQYGVDIDIKSMIPAVTIKGTTTNGVTTGYGMSVKVVKEGTSAIGTFTTASDPAFEVEALTSDLPSGAVLVWFDGTVIDAKMVLSAAASVGDTKLAGTLSVGVAPDGETGYQEQTLTVEYLHETHNDPSGNSIIVGKALYFDNRASFITTANSTSGAETIKGTVHLNKLDVGTKGYGELKVFIGNTGFGNPIRITDGPFPRTISQIITASGSDVSKIKIQANEHWAGEIDSITLTEPASVVLTTTTGPASNADIGPVFQRKSNANTDIKPPLSGGSIDGTNWEEVTGHKIYGLGTIYGVGTFNDPNGNETVLVATSTGLYGASENSYFSLIPIPDGEVFTETVEFVQAFHEVLCFRGFDKRPLILRNMVTGLESVEQQETDTDLEENEAGDGTESIPNAKTGVFYQNRMFIPISKDEVIVSDFLNPTRYQSILSEFRINTGTSDSLVGLKIMDETTGTLLAFKEHSVYRISNVYGALESVVMDTITLDYGAINPKVITSVGKDCWFLSSKRGLCSIGLADNAKLTGAEVPVSEAIDPVIKSINWQAAKDVACSAYINNHFYLALPTEGSTEVNKILVYSFINQAWAGYDTSTAITGMKGFTELTYGGARRLFFIDKNGFFHLYDDYAYGSDTDDIPNASTGVVTKTAIASEVLTRGYIAGDISFKKWRTARVQMKTQNPTFTVDAEFEGVNESVNLVTDKTYDRTKYDRPYDRADYVVTSVSNFFDPYRQDYTVQANDFATALTDAVASGAVFDPDLMADHENRYAFRGEGRYMQLRIKNTTGKHEVTALSVGAIPSETLIQKKQ
jgi:hypothetical protein